jgi:hypothetical protein
MTRNTAVVVASAPCYPHGVVDDVAGIARVRACVCKGEGARVHACMPERAREREREARDEEQRLHTLWMNCVVQ